ncbi:MAG: 23S rRNA (pseudouridine(1915)-N(3))-methyltransferase RlmH [Coriobacteriia bacterium]|nr:23S rRNA (pseudouridine(1915)-N(3))-methyltransferase RlmH [Coriobacteriia bacterium]
MKISVIAVGRLKERYWREAADEYIKRLRPHATLEVIEVPDRDVTRDEVRAVAEEGADVLRAIPDGAHVIALDIGGIQRSSTDIADRLGALGLEGRSAVAFVVGGAAGLSSEVIARADERLSLGRITLPHQLARVVLLEQLYRAFKIMHNEPYHR